MKKTNHLNQCQFQNQSTDCISNIWLSSNKKTNGNNDTKASDIQIYVFL